MIGPGFIATAAEACTIDAPRGTDAAVAVAAGTVRLGLPLEPRRSLHQGETNPIWSAGTPGGWEGGARGRRFSAAACLRPNSLRLVGGEFLDADKRSASATSHQAVSWTAFAPKLTAPQDIDAEAR